MRTRPSGCYSRRAAVIIAGPGELAGRGVQGCMSGGGGSVTPAEARGV